MPSISTLFLLATTAFAAFSSAAPTSHGTNNVGNAIVDPNTAVNAKGEALDLNRRCNGPCSTIPDIIADVHAQVTVVSEKLGM